MPEYHVLARRYRPQTFTDVMGQNAAVATLKNAIKFNKIAHAYLFCGPRGTGKTSIARIFAKALNCADRTENGEPCNLCSSCKEIAQGNSLEVIEIDGASNRGIEDIRQINESVGYSTPSGGYKVYIIDEVHMLTKEAFNALLKTLEEPPPKVKFFFATTEPHKVLPTILSRCQRFQLNRISTEQMLTKLQKIAKDLNVSASDDALRLIVNRADGGLRDAESLFDQVLSFHEGEINAEVVSEILGIMANDVFFALDEAGKAGDFIVAFEIANNLFSQGKDLIHFVECLLEHYRNLLLIKLAGPDIKFLVLSEEEREKAKESAALYTKEQCLEILDYLVEAQNQIRFMPSTQIALENILLHILRTHHRVPIEVVVQRLVELEKNIKETGSMPSQEQKGPPPPKVKPSKPSQTIHEDPTPTAADLGNSPPQKKKQKEKTKPLSIEEQGRFDTLMQFAAVELDGRLEKK